MIFKSYKKYINEKFTEESDPIKDLGIGVSIESIKKFLIDKDKPYYSVKEIHTFSFLLKNKRYDFADYLLSEKIITLNSINNYVLGNIIYIDDIESAKYLISRGANIDIAIKMCSRINTPKTYQKLKNFKELIENEKNVNEKFTEESDPIHDLGIGIYGIHNFNNTQEVADFIIEIIPVLFKTEKIPDDIIYPEHSRNLFGWGYYEVLNNYIKKHIFLNNKQLNIESNSFIYLLHNKLLKLGYPKADINEKFTDNDSDPIKDLGIGLYRKINFNYEEKIASYIIKILPGILNKNKIPTDIISTPYYLMNKKYIAKVDKFLEKYITLNNESIHPSNSYEIFELMLAKLKKMGFKHNIDDVNEKFIEDSDPIKDMGIGLYYEHNFNNITEIYKFLLKSLPYILKTKKIPKDIIYNDTYLLNPKYITVLNDYVEKYVKINNHFIEDHVRWHIYKMLMDTLIKKGYKRK